MTNPEFEKYCESLREEANGKDEFGFKSVASNDVEETIALRKKFREEGWGKEEESDIELSEEETKKLMEKINNSMMYE